MDICRPFVYYYYTASELFMTNPKHHVVAVNDYFEINKVGFHPNLMFLIMWCTGLARPLT